MRQIYDNCLLEMSVLDNNEAKLNYLTSVLRSLIQAVVIINFEIFNDKLPEENELIVELSEKFRKPVDGYLVYILDTLIPVARSSIDRSYMIGWFEPNSNTGTALSRDLLEWVEFRNKRPGHGVLDEVLYQEWSSKTESLISKSLLVFKDIIPRCVEGKLLLNDRYGNLEIETPIVYEGKAIVAMSIFAKKSIWRLKGQVLSRSNAKEFVVILKEDNVFNLSSVKSRDRFDLAEISLDEGVFSFYHNIPVRQTDTFEGRGEEIESIKEWLNDEDSRYCLIYGDGGYGKTTLVLELLNQLIEDQLDVKGRVPSVFSYHTAKKTKWNENGLTYLTSSAPVMDECLRELVRLFYPVLKPEWYAVSGKQLVDKVKGVLVENGLNRNDLILIIDNTETLATDLHEVKELGAFFRSVGKSIGRVIITSRRREFIEATPVLIEGLSEQECVNLMRRLAEEFNAKPIIKAGNASLRRVSKQLMYKPLLIEALVKYLSRGEMGIDAAINNVFKRSSDELLEFLYEDAWLRLQDLQKEVFFVLINVSSPLDQVVISKACQEVGINHTEFQAGLEETHFSIISDHGRTYTVELVDLARRFFYMKFSKLTGCDKDRLKVIVEKVDNYALQREAIDSEWRQDRVAEAFRSEFAKVAKISAGKGEIRKAIEYYELAIEDDPLNSALHDRFAWFLFNKVRDFSYAVSISEKAVELDGDNCDALVGLALAKYRLGDLSGGDVYINKSVEKGRPLAFGLLRKGIARYYKSKGENLISDKISSLEEASKLFVAAEKANRGRSGGYDIKNHKEITIYKAKAGALLARYRSARKRGEIYYN